MRAASDDSLLLEDIPAGHTVDAIPPPAYWSSAPKEDVDPMAYNRKPVTSAHMIDLIDQRVSTKDSVSLSVTNPGKITHDIYGELPSTSSVPLEYLALLRPSAEGVAAVNYVQLSKSKSSDSNSDNSKATVLVFGASQPAGLAATQMATSKNMAVVAVVGGEHSGNDEMCDIIKGLTNEPGTMVPEEYAMVKSQFNDLVNTVVTGTTTTSTSTTDADTFLSDFQQNLLDYIATYPEHTLPAAVDKEELMFQGKDKDRTYFRENMEAYLSQFPKGAPPIPPQDLMDHFPKEQYAIFKRKFGIQATNVVSGEATTDFDPSDIVKHMMSYPEQQTAMNSTFEFDILNPTTTTHKMGGPIAGAIIAVTPYLASACEAVHKEKTLRAKAEALQFLTDAERNSFAAANAVYNLAKKNNAKVVVVGGSLPGLTSVEPTPADVQEALSAMEIEDDGTCKLNHFVQVYRAGDFPIYADYAVHRATEVLAGPRQVVVTK